MADSTNPNVEEPRPVGVEDMDELLLETMEIDPAEFSAGMYSDYDATIIGFRQIAGGEPRERNDGTPFITQDQIAFKLRVNNWEELGADNDYHELKFTQPKKITGTDGKPRRAKPNRNSSYAKFLASFAECGVAADKQQATVIHAADLFDFIGLRAHFVQKEQEGRNGAKYNATVIEEIYGCENEIRAQIIHPATGNKLVPHKIETQEPGASAAS